MVQGASKKSLALVLWIKKIGEYWAISAHDNGLSKIKNGKYKGETLKDVYLNHRELFANDPHDKFPLLVKINEIQEPCSVQVHPDDAYARKHEKDYGKAEFCLWLDVEEGTKIIRGHSAKTKEEFRKAIEEKLGILYLFENRYTQMNLSIRLQEPFMVLKES